MLKPVSTGHVHVHLWAIKKKGKEPNEASVFSITQIAQVLTGGAKWAIKIHQLPTIDLGHFKEAAKMKIKMKTISISIDSITTTNNNKESLI